MSEVVDLRSDTVTRPSAAMREAMAAAAVGDDVYGEDPTINALEAEVAAAFGMAAGVFVPSGTMGNQIALRLICPPAQEMLCDADAHIVNYEGGGAAQHGGIQTRTVVAPRGLLTRPLLEPQVRMAGYHAVTTRAMAVELTHMRGGGAVYPIAVLRDLREMADERDLKMHCDGARIWNAHVASGIPLGEYGALFDTMSVCMSKGLGAPVGSLLLVRHPPLADAARVLRHRLGGAMRQAGIIAEGARFAFNSNVSRLADDHARARVLASSIAEMLPGSVDLEIVETNIVYVDLSSTGLDANRIAERCAESGVLLSVLGPQTLRLVTHLDVDDAGVERALAVIRPALAAG